MAVLFISLDYIHNCHFISNVDFFLTYIFLFYTISLYNLLVQPSASQRLLSNVGRFAIPIRSPLSVSPQMSWETTKESSSGEEALPHMVSFILGNKSGMICVWHTCSHPDSANRSQPSHAMSVLSLSSQVSFCGLSVLFLCKAMIIHWCHTCFTSNSMCLDDHNYRSFAWHLIVLVNIFVLQRWCISPHVWLLSQFQFKVSNLHSINGDNL